MLLMKEKSIVAQVYIKHNYVDFLEFVESINRNFLKIPLKKLTSTVEGIEVSLEDFLGTYKGIFYSRDFEHLLYKGEKFKQFFDNYLTSLYKS
jgi:hypothetical protein